MADSEKKNLTGGCHCGHIRYTVAFAVPAEPKAYRCNCTFCQKLSFTSLKLPSSEDFKLVSPASYEECGDYRQQRGKNDVHKYFCTKCGSHVVGVGQYEFKDTVHDFFAVNLNTLDQPQEGLELSNWKLEYIDGLHDNWMAGVQDHPWKGGLI